MLEARWRLERRNRHLLDQLAPGKLLKGLDPVDPEILFPFDQTALKDGRLAR